MPIHGSEFLIRGFCAYDILKLEDSTGVAGIHKIEEGVKDFARRWLRTLVVSHREGIMKGYDYQLE
jgi:hypothetical protein